VGISGDEVDRSVVRNAPVPECAGMSLEPSYLVVLCLLPKG